MKIKRKTIQSISKRMVFFICLFSISISAFAQSKNITGKIIDETGEPQIGAVVKVKNTDRAVVPDFDGNYSVTANVGEVLVFSCLGAETKEIVVESNSSIINVTLANVGIMLGEVEISVGYGKIKKRDLTGSIVSISGDEIKSAPANNAMKALQGKVPGLNITNVGGAGSSPDIKLRGVATLNADTKPLFVVDGMLLDNIDFVNTNDIVSIEVLKDPSSLAIFGVQGANGVIIITTARAKPGETQVNYNGYAGVQYLHSRDHLKLTNAEEFTMLYNEKLQNESPGANEWVPDVLGKGTNWQNEILRPALITSHSISVGRSTDKSTSYLSLGYFKQDGIVKYDSYQRINANISEDYIVNKSIKVGANINLSRWDSDPATASVQNAAWALPTYVPYRPREEWDSENIGSKYTPSPDIQKDVANPIAGMGIKKGTSESYGYRSVGNAYAEISFLKDFTFKATGYYDVGISYGSQYNPIFNVNTSTSTSSHKNEVASFSRNTAEYTKYQADFTLNYNKQVDKHRIGALVGYTAHVNTSKGFNATTDSIQGNDPNLIEDFWVLDGSVKKIHAGDWFNDESFASYISRINYSYADRYLLTATFRADGSSKFSPSKRWGYFPSVGLGWIVSEEAFMEPLRDKVEFLKLKASWGKLGNDKIGNYMYFRKINPKGQQVVVDGQTYYLPTVDGLVDKDLHWEVVTGLDLGLETSLLNQRLSIDFGYYTKKTSDLLAYVSVPASVGAGYGITNAGSMRNSGIEFMVSWNDRINDFQYGLSFNGSTLHNKVLSIGNDNSPISTGTYHRTAVGHSVGSFYGYVQDGIFQTDQEAANYYPSSWTSKAGDIRYKDINKDGKIDENDRTFIGSPIPSFVYGMSVNLAYKDFDLSVDFNGVSGNKILNQKKLPTFTQFNFYTSTLDRWHGEGTSNKEPILNSQRGHNYLPSTNLLESGAYLRLKSIQLGYNVPRSVLNKMKINKMRLFVNADNVLTFKKNSGYTPEIGGGVLNGGIDNGGTYPLPTVYTGGITLSF